MFNFLLTAFLILAGLGWAFYTERLSFPQGYVPAQPEAGSPMPAETTGQIVPDFTFTDLSGKQHGIADFRGKTVILNFWATWCAPCVVEMPQLFEIAASRDDIVLIGLSSDLSAEPIQKFLRKMDQDHLKSADIILALDEKRRITQGIFGTYRLPESIIISPDGRMIRKIVGAIDWHQETL